MIYKVYWLHHRHHTDPYSQGYIGITKEENIQRRLGKHHITKKFKNLIVEVLHVGLEAAEALQLEMRYRPEPGIGFNRCRGGGHI